MERRGVDTDVDPYDDEYNGDPLGWKADFELMRDVVSTFRVSVILYCFTNLNPRMRMGMMRMIMRMRMGMMRMIMRMKMRMRMRIEMLKRMISWMWVS